MSDTQDDPLLGLLTDIAEGVATLAARVDAMETVAAAHQAQVNKALATIAEIATRAYYASKPSSALPETYCSMLASSFFTNPRLAALDATELYLAASETFSVACVRKILSPQTTGVELPSSGSATFHFTLVVSDQVSM